MELNSAVVFFISQDGQTLKIAERIESVLLSNGVKVRKESMDSKEGDWAVNPDQLPIVCAPVRYGKHLPEACRFVRRYKERLRECPAAMVSINLSARKPDRSSPETNPYLKRFLARENWRPTWQAVFAGALEYERYPWYDRLMIRLIMKMTGGPQQGGQRYEFTDWDAVDRFALELVSAINKAQD